MNLYVGRIVCVSCSPDGHVSAAYRVSSRSFPNRTAVLGDRRVSIIPRPGHEADIQKNPYIAYNCIRVVANGRIAVATNGSHTDPIAEKIDLGVPIREALALTHLAMDYEKDEFNTPRISGVVDRESGAVWLAIVREDGLNVRRYALTPGQFAYVATYEENDLAEPHTEAFDAHSADTACAFVLTGGPFAKRTNPVTAAAAFASGNGFELHAQDAASP